MAITKRGVKERMPVRYYCENPATRRMEEVFEESEITDTELVVPMYWAGTQYCTVPGTEFHGPIPPSAEDDGGPDCDGCRRPVRWCICP